MPNTGSRKYYIEISPDIDPMLLKVIGRYWDFDGIRFREKIGEIAKSYDRSYHNLLPLISQFSSVYIFDTCFGCGDELRIEVKSQTRFLCYFSWLNHCEKCLEI